MKDATSAAISDAATDAAVGNMRFCGVSQVCLFKEGAAFFKSHSQAEGAQR